MASMLNPSGPRWSKRWLMVVILAAAAVAASADQLMVEPSIDGTWLEGGRNSSRDMIHTHSVGRVEVAGQGPGGQSSRSATDSDPGTAESLTGTCAWNEAPATQALCSPRVDVRRLCLHGAPAIKISDTHMRLCTTVLHHCTHVFLQARRVVNMSSTHCNCVRACVEHADLARLFLARQSTLQRPRYPRFMLGFESFYLDNLTSIHPCLALTCRPCRPNCTKAGCGHAQAPTAQGQARAKAGLEA